MPSTYAQIQRQIESLQRQAGKLREQEIGGVIARIKVAIAHYGLSAEQLGLDTAAARVGRRSGRKPVVDSRPKYQDETGNQWSGRGPRPRWLREALAAGRSLEEFAAATSAATANRMPSKHKRARRARTHYRDQDGRSWSGMGPRPKWLKEALAAGRSLQEFAIED